jgi:Phage phiEco32-like COOH.NH2 ligase-type 2
MPDQNDNGQWGFGGISNQTLRNYSVELNTQPIWQPSQAQAYQYSVAYSSPKERKLDDWVKKYGEKCQKKHEKRIAKKQDSEEGGVVINNFLLGCDPEFIALDTLGKTVHLDIEEEEIGTDHGGRVGEFRPKPCKGAYALTKRIQRLILSPTVQRIQAAKLRAGARANEESLGGHVHFGFKNPVQPVTYYDPNDRNTPYKVKNKGDDTIVKALDKVTGLLEHLDILPLQESSNRRRGSYGKWGDVRDSGGHTEYRSMCSWLYDPKVAFLCLTAAKLAAADPKGTLETLNKVTGFEGLRKWIIGYRSKDSNALRVLNNIPEHKMVQVDPSVDFRERWRELGL